MKTLTRQGIQRMTINGTIEISGGSGSGGSGGGGSSDYAAEAGHAQTADNLTNNSTDWEKIARKDIAQSIAEVFTFAKGIVSTLVSKFKAGIKIGANDDYGIDENGDATIRDLSTRNISTNGNVSVEGKITATGNVEATGGIGKFGGLNVGQDATIGGDIDIDGTARVDDDLTVGHDVYINGKTNGFAADFTDVSMDNLGKTTDKVANIHAVNTNTDNIRVTGEAHFFKLIVDEFMSNKGALIISNANCVAEKVVLSGSTYKVYFSKTDKDGNAVTNPWVLGDQALCLTYKGEGAGTFADVKNRYYWRIVTTVTSDDNDYHMIGLSNTGGQYDGSTTPDAGDNIVQLGYAGSVSANAYRKSAVILSSYPTMDSGVTPPSLAFYKGINDFNLSSHRYTFIDGLNNEFMGNFKILVNGSYTNLTTVLATMEGLLSVVQKTVIGKNIIPSEGWQDVAGNLLDSDTFIPSTQKLNAGTDDILYTPMMYLKEGTYIFSCYTDDADAEIYVYTSSTNKAKPNEMPWGESIHFDGVVSGDTYTPSGGSALPRRYATIEIQSDCYACLNIMDDMNDLIIYRPQLEEGSTATAWEIGNVEVRSSELKQTADLIRLQVGNCGLDLTNSKILAKTNKFEIQNTSGVKTFGVDADGNLESTGNASFKGTVKAENFYQAMTLVWNNRKVWVLDVDPTANHITYIWYHTLCTDSGFITYQNNALGQGNRYSVGDIIPYDQHYDSDDFFNPSGGAFGPVGIGNFLAYTNVSSIIEIVDDYQNLMLSGIAIPAAKDMPGKTITVKNRASNRPVNIYARSVDGSVAHQFYPRVDGYPSYDATYATETKQITSGTLDLYSDGTYWLII